METHSMSTGHTLSVEQMESEARFCIRDCGKVVSSLCVNSFVQKIRNIQMRMAGIGGVYTKRSHRKKGLARALLEYTQWWIREKNYDTVMLYGIPNFYGKFGFAPAFPDVRYEMSIQNITSMDRSHEIWFVPFASIYREDVLKIYDHYNLKRNGVVQRNSTWTPKRKDNAWSSSIVCMVGLTQNSRVVGYYILNGDKSDFSILEIGSISPKWFNPILISLRDLFKWNGKETIEMRLPEDDTFAGYCEPMGIRKHLTHRRDGGALVRMGNISCAVNKLQAVPSGQETSLKGVSIITDSDRFSIELHNGNWKIAQWNASFPAARMPGWALAQLLYGYSDSCALLGRGDMGGDEQVVNILTRLFPREPHYLYTIDSF